MIHPEHICRFNDGDSSCSCYDAGYEAGGSVNEFADTLRDNPAEIIAWIDREVAEYEKLRAILLKRNVDLKIKK